MRLSGRISELIKSLTRGLRFGIAVGCPIGLLYGILFTLIQARGLFSGLPDVLEGVILFGLLVGPVVGLAFALIDFLSRGDSAQKALSPSRSYRGDRSLTLIIGFAGGLAVEMIVGWGDLTPIGLGVGLAFGLVFVLAKSASSPFFVAGIAQASRRRLPVPWHLMPMLEDCLRLGLLRTIGPVYQFRHAALQDYLASNRPMSAP